MDYRLMLQVFDQINEGVAGDELLISLKADLIKAAVAYARIRTDYQLAPLEEKKEMEARRKAKHNALIDAANILSRNMNERELPIAWRYSLTNDRKVIGDFACLLHAHLGILAR